MPIIAAMQPVEGHISEQERVLRLWVLIHGIADYCAVKHIGGKPQRYLKCTGDDHITAVSWLESDEDRDSYSFAGICDLMGVDHRLVRQRIQSGRVDLKLIYQSEAEKHAARVERKRRDRENNVDANRQKQRERYRAKQAAAGKKVDSSKGRKRKGDNK